MVECWHGEKRWSLHYSGNEALSELGWSPRGSNLTNVTKQEDSSFLLATCVPLNERSPGSVVVSMGKQPLPFSTKASHIPLGLVRCSASKCSVCARFWQWAQLAYNTLKTCSPCWKCWFGRKRCSLYSGALYHELGWSVRGCNLTNVAVQEASRLLLAKGVPVTERWPGPVVVSTGKPPFPFFHLGLSCTIGVIEMLSCQKLCVH